MTTAYRSSCDRKVYGGSITSVSFYDLICYLHLPAMLQGILLYILYCVDQVICSHAALITSNGSCRTLVMLMYIFDPACYCRLYDCDSATLCTLVQKHLDHCYVFK